MQLITNSDTTPTSQGVVDSDEIEGVSSAIYKKATFFFNNLSATTSIYNYDDM